jgi:MFS family permease
MPKPGARIPKSFSTVSDPVILDAYAAFRSRDFRLLLTSTALANLGLQMLSVAVSWDLYSQTHSARVLGGIGFVQVTPSFAFAILAGHIADRYNRRTIMLAAQCLTVIASLLVSRVHGVAGIYVCLFLIATTRTFQMPIRGAVLPDIVPPEALSNAITWNATLFESANVGGPALAGIIIAMTGAPVVYMVQAGCALAVLLCLAGVNFNRKHEVQTGSALEGLRFIRDNKLILTAVSLDLFAYLFGGATALLPIYAVDILHAGPRALGWLRAAPSVGAITMAVTMAHSPRIRRAGRVMLWSVAGFGLATIGFGLSRSIWLSCAMLALTGAFDNVSVVLRQSVLQTKTPDFVRGRVMAVNSIFINCSNSLGAVESGWTAAWFGPVLSVAGGGAAAMAVVAICALLSPSLRRWEQYEAGS